MIQTAVKAPSLAAFETMGGGKVPSFSGIQVILPMGIQCKDHRSVLGYKFLHQLSDALFQLRRFGEAQRAVHKVLLIVHHH